ncbi:MAG: hypothetical protein HC915_06585 [Anaerolineae bacterium]|nr:hypothetical protein [Anaerolineae bacterium]
MSINFFEPGDVPKPRDQIRIERIESSLYADRRRLKVTIHVTPFLERPNLAVRLITTEDEPHTVGEMNIIETMHRKMEFTLHLRSNTDPAGDYLLQARLYYQNLLEADETEALTPTIVDEQAVPVSIPQDMPPEAGAEGYLDSEEAQRDE